jgi:hypothetical protein
MYHQPMERHHHGFVDSQLTNDQDWVRGLNSTPPACHLTSEATYSSYHSPYEDLHRPYYSSSSTLYDSSSSSSDRLSPSIASRASSLLPSSEPYRFETAHQGLGFASYNDEGFGERSCVTMQVIQKTADTSYEEPTGSFGGYEVYEPQEVVPVTSDDYDPPSSPYVQRPIPIVGVESSCDLLTPEPEAVPEPKSEPDSEYEPEPDPSLRRRRTTTTRRREKPQPSQQTSIDSTPSRLPSNQRTPTTSSRAFPRLPLPTRTLRLHRSFQRQKRMETARPNTTLPPRFLALRPVHGII